MIEHLLSEDAFNHAWEEASRVASEIEATYFPQTDGRYGTTGTDDYQLQQNDIDPKACRHTAAS